MKKMIKTVLRILFSFFCNILPLNKTKIVCFNFFGKSFGDNPKYLAEELSQSHHYDVVWLSTKQELLPDGVRWVRFDSFKCYYELKTAKAIIYNIRNYHPVKKRKGQIYIQTWHAGLGFKRVEKAALDTLDKKYVEMARYDGRICDAILASSSYNEMNYLNNFWLNNKTEILKLGIPRNDIFFSTNFELKKEIKNQLNLPDDVYVVLYAPTFRDNRTSKFSVLNYSQVIDDFEKREQTKCVLLIRYHPLNKNVECDVEKKDNRIIDVTNYPDGQELSLIANCVITDYSSIVFDFLLQNKPGYLLVEDFEDYMKVRGVNDNFTLCPFPKCKNQTELSNVVLSDTLEKMKNRYSDYKNLVRIYDDGNSTKNISEWIIKKINGE